MPGLEDLYREIILDHYRSPRNRGELPTPPAVVAQGHNPLCGDEITVFLQVDDGVVSDVKVGGQGCSISQSSASMMSQAIKGQPVDEVRALVRRFKGMMSIEDAEHADGNGRRRRDRGARRPRGAAGRRQVPGAHQVRHAGLEHAARRPRASRTTTSTRNVARRDRRRRPSTPRPRPSRAGDPPARPRPGRPPGGAELLERGRDDARRADRRLDAGGRASDQPDSFGSESWTEQLPQGDGRRLRRPPVLGALAARGASTSRCTATATRSRACSRSARPRGSAGSIPRRHRRRPVRRRVRLRARHPPGAGVHRRAVGPLRAADAAAPPAGLPRPAGRARRPQDLDRGRAGRRRATDEVVARGRGLFITVDRAAMVRASAQLPAPPDEGP